jgi:hypothetical protein
MNKKFRKPLKIALCRPILTTKRKPIRRFDPIADIDDFEIGIPHLKIEYEKV